MQDSSTKRRHWNTTSASLDEIPLDGFRRICSMYIRHRGAPIPRATTMRSIGWQCEHFVVANAHACRISGGAVDELDSRLRGVSAHDAPNNTMTSVASRAVPPPVREVVTRGGT
jgi:hypothetical protein